MTIAALSCALFCLAPPQDVRPEAMVDSARFMSTLNALPTNRAVRGNIESQQGLVKTEELVQQWLTELGYTPRAEALSWNLKYQADQEAKANIPARKALNGFADLKGLKIRVPPGMIAEVMGRAGAAVVNLPGGEVFNALSSGVIDATDWASPSQNHGVGLYKAAKFSINASHSMPTTEVSISKKKWAELPADVKKLIEDGVRKLDADMRTAMKAEDGAALEKMKAEGVTVIEWPKTEVDKLRSVTSRVQMELGGRNDQARKMLDSLRAHMGKLGYSLS